MQNAELQNFINHNKSQVFKHEILILIVVNLGQVTKINI